MDAMLTAPGMNAQPAAVLAKATSGKGTDAAGQARKAAEEFEAVFLTTMLEGMFTGLKTDGLGGGGKSEKVYRSMMVGEYAKEIAATGGIGIADHVYREILAVQESMQK